MLRRLCARGRSIVTLEKRERSVQFVLYYDNQVTMCITCAEIRKARYILDENLRQRGHLSD
jgi:hypothetical protein